MALGSGLRNIGDMLKRAAHNLRGQTVAFKRLVKERGMLVKDDRIGWQIIQPDWQLIIVASLSAIALSFLFFDEAAMAWRMTISQATFGFFRTITDLGKSELLLIPAAIALLALGLFSWKGLSKSAKASLAQAQLLGLYVFVAIAGSGIANNLIKLLVGRARPRNFEELGAFHFAPPGLDSSFQSFPSGHSATAGAMAIIFVLVFPRLRWIWVAIAAWVALSRVIVGSHFPSDAIAGFVFGASFAWGTAFWFAKRRLLFRARLGYLRLANYSGLQPKKLYKALHLLCQKA